MDRVGATPRAPACTYARAWAEGCNSKMVQALAITALGACAPWD